MIKFSPVVVLVLGLHFCMGQGISTHTIAGVLQDQTGAVIVGAEVVLLAPDGSNVGTTSTNKAGESNSTHGRPDHTRWAHTRKVSKMERQPSRSWNPQ